MDTDGHGFWQREFPAQLENQLDIETVSYPCSSVSIRGFKFSFVKQFKVAPFEVRRRDHPGCHTDGNRGRGFVRADTKAVRHGLRPTRARRPNRHLSRLRPFARFPAPGLVRRSESVHWRVEAGSERVWRVVRPSL